MANFLEQLVAEWYEYQGYLFEETSWLVSGLMAAGTAN